MTDKDFEQFKADVRALIDDTDRLRAQIERLRALLKEAYAGNASLTSENERLREALRHWVFLYAWKADGMNMEQAKIHADAFMMSAALQPKEGEG